MRTKLLFFLSAVCLSVSAFAQVNPTTGQTPSGQSVVNPATTETPNQDGENSGEPTAANPDNSVEGTLKQFEKLKRKIDGIKKELEKSEKESIGFLKIRNTDVIIYQDQKKIKRKYLENVKKDIIPNGKKNQKNAEDLVPYSKPKHSNTGNSALPNAPAQPASTQPATAVNNNTVAQPTANTPKKIDKYSIDKAYISIRNGYINNIEVYLNGEPKKFVNKTAPIGITHKRFTTNLDALYESSYSKSVVKTKNDTIRKDINRFIILQDFIDLDSLQSYLPDDIDIIYDVNKTDKKTKKAIDKFELKKDSGINSIFDIRLYSDALALFGEEENGLAQIDFRYKNVLHKTNLKNTGLYLVQYFKVYFNASKFDSKDLYIDATSFTGSELLRKENLKADVAANLFNGWLGLKSASRYYADIGMGIGSAKVKTATDTLSVTTTNYFVEGGVNLKSSKFMGVDFNVRLMKLFSPSTTEYNQSINTQVFNYMRYSVDFYWSPNEAASRFFARVNFVTPTSTVDKINQFFQVQVGYSLLLSELINK